MVKFPTLVKGSRMKYIRFVVVLLMGVVTLPANATSLYANFTVSQFQVDTGAEKANPRVNAIKLGYQFADAIAIEAQMGKSGSDDSIGDGKLKVDNVSSLMLRFGGTSSYNDVKLYLLAGQTKAKLKYDGTAVVIDDKYQANFWGVGAEENSRAIKNMAYVLEYLQHSKYHGTSITAITLGLRYNFF